MTTSEPQRPAHGLRVLLLDTKLRNPNHYIVIGLQRALQQHAGVAHVEMASYRNLAELARTGAYDLLLAVDGENTSVEILAAARPWVKVMALYCFEDPYERDVTSSFAPLFDLVFTNDIGSVDAYPGGAIHLPLAATPDFEERPVRAHDRDYEFDVAFVGSAWPNRVVILKRLLAARPDLKWRIVLQYNEHLPPAVLELPESSYMGSVSHFDFVEIANRSRINLSLHRAFSGDGRSTRALNPGPRIFELGLAGGFQLIDSHETDVGSFFTSGTHVETFAGVEECLAKIDECLQAPDRRIAMARAAQERTRSAHLYHHRVATILDAVRAVVPKPHTPVVTTTRPKLLYVTHNVLAQGHFGGVEVYQDTVIRETLNRYEIFFYKPVNPSTRPHHRQFALTNSRNEILAEYFTPDFEPVLTLTQPEAEQAFARAISEYGFDLVHFQHLLGHVASLPLIAKMMGLPTVFTAHDYYAVCTRFNLLDHRDAYCRIATRPVTVCDNCLHQTERRPRGSQSYRRSFMSQVLLSFDAVAATPATANVLTGVYPELADRGNIHFTSIPVPPSGPTNRTKPSEDTQHETEPALEIVFLGNFTNIKGASLFLHAADALRERNIHFTLCGRVDDNLKEVLSAFNLPNLTIRGGFSPGEANLDEFDMSLHLSNWPETYCITLSEAWKAGVIPVVTAIGAMMDRVEHEKTGYVIPVDGAGELVALLQRIEGNRRELDRIRASVTPALWQTGEEHCVQLGALYDKLLAPAAGRTLGQEPLGRFPVSVLPTLALSGHPINSQIWANPKELNGPSLPNPSRVYLDPLRLEVQAMKAALGSGSLDPFPSARLAIGLTDAAGRPLPAVDGLRAIDVGASFRVQGTIGESDERTSPPILALRSLNGDVVLRPLTVEVKVKDGIRSFVSEPISANVLSTGVYGVELVSFRSTKPQVLGTAGAILLRGSDAQGAVKAAVTCPDDARVPLEIDPWAGLIERRGLELLGRVDRLEVAEIASGYTIAGSAVSLAWRLAVAGWLTEMGGSYSPLATMLRLTGPRSYVLPLNSHPRPDMAGSAGTEHTLIGYRGAMWVHGMAPGRYTCAVVQRTPSGLVVQQLSEYVLHVVDGDA